MENAGYKEYAARYTKRLHEFGYSFSSMETKIYDKLLANGVITENDDIRNLLFNWARGYRNIPSVGVLAVIAKILNTNIGYLIGYTDCSEVENKTDKVNIDIDHLCDEYRHTHNNRLLTTDANIYSVFKNKAKSENAPWFKVKTFNKILSVSGYSIDYVLGLTDNKYKDPEINDLSLLDKLKSGSVVELLRYDERYYGIVCENPTEIFSVEEGISSIDKLKEKAYEIIPVIETISVINKKQTE